MTKGYYFCLEAAPVYSSRSYWQTNPSPSASQASTFRMSTGHSQILWEHFCSQIIILSGVLQRKSYCFVERACAPQTSPLGFVLTQAMHLKMNSEVLVLGFSSKMVDVVFQVCFI